MGWILQSRFAHLDHVQEAVFVLDNTRAIVFGNATATEHFGAHQLGQDIVQIIRNPRCLELIGDALEGAAKGSAAVSFGPPANGLFDVRVSRFRDASTQEDLLLVSLRDVNEAQLAQKVRSDFVANVSHELRSPLSTISGFIETLKGPARDDTKARARFLDLMEQEADRMVRLIADLLSLSKLQANRGQRPVGRVDLVKVIQAVQTSLTKLAQKQGKTVTFDCADDSIIIPGEEDELVQVVQNLLENAIKYSGPESNIQLTVERMNSVQGVSGPVVAFTVADKGQGIAREHLFRLTERFYRVDSHRSRADGGTGLGLAIVKHIVQRHRGKLKIESEVGVGSTFTIILPSTKGQSSTAVT